MNLTIFCSFLMGCTSISSAKVNPVHPELPPLLVSPESESIKLGAQKLEFSATSGNGIQVGNLLFSNKMLSIEKAGNDTLRIHAPYQFLIGGTLILKDPLGKALWSKKIYEPTEIEKITIEEKDFPNLKKDTGRYTLTDLSQLIPTLKKQSFFTYCLYSESPKNRIQLCSPQYKIESKGENHKVVINNSEPSEPSVVVNGEEVNEHGVIQFDKNIQTASIAAILSTGMSIDIRTDSVPIDILDITLNENGSEIQLWLREKKSLSPYPLTWSAKTKAADPFFYIEAFGQAPLRQEFFVNPQFLLKESERPQVIEGINKTYSSSVEVHIKKTKNQSFKIKDQGDELFSSGNHNVWTLNNLIVGKGNRHSLVMTSNKNKFLASYEVERAKSWVLALNGTAGTDQTTSKSETAENTVKTSQSGALLSLQKYFDSFLGFRGDYSHLRWGLQYEYANRQVKSETKTESRSHSSTYQGLDVFYRFKSGIHHQEPTTSFGLSTLMIQNTTDANAKPIQWLGLKVIFDGGNLQGGFWGDAYEAQWTYYATCLTSETCKDTNLFTTLSWQSRYQISDMFFWNWKPIVTYTTSKQEESSTQSVQAEMQLGLGVVF